MNFANFNKYHFLVRWSFSTNHKDIGSFGFNKKTFSTFSRDPNFIDKLNIRKFDETKLSEWSYGSYSKSICGVPSFIVIHNNYYYVNVSIWFPNKVKVFEHLNSSIFQQILKIHSEKFGSIALGWYYYDEHLDALYVHPFFVPFFAAASNKRYCQIIFKGTIKTITYVKLFNFFPQNIYSKLHGIISFTDLQDRRVIFQIPEFEFLLINYLRQILPHSSWESFNFYWTFYCFKAKSCYKYKILYFGIVGGEITLSEKLKQIYNNYEEVELFCVVRFYDYKELLDWFNKFIKDLKKLNSPIKKKTKGHNLEAFYNISYEQFQKILAYRYHWSSHLCSICPYDIIKNYNQKK